MSPEDKFIEEAKASLNREQFLAFKECIHGVGSILCTGQGGTGKSRVIQCVTNYFRQFSPADGEWVAVTASTGMAAYNVSGMTLHRFAGVGIEESNLGAMISKANGNPNSRDNWERTGTLIIDEISMISKTLFENLSVVARSIRDSDEPFGGIRLLMFGDFLQLSPISKVDSSHMRVFNADVWRELDPQIILLSTIMRQSDSLFQSVLSELRLGICSDQSEDYIRSLDRPVEYDDGIEAVKLFSKRASVDSYNKQRLDMIHSPSKVYHSEDTGEKSVLNQCPAPAVIFLKIGCQIVVTRNLTSSIVNGSVGVVTGFRYSSETRSFQPTIRVKARNSREEDYTVSPCSWETIRPDGTVLAMRVQIPLVLGWALTIHKSQGQTIPRVVVDLDGLFDNGQGYVALSRCPDPQNMQVLNFKKHLLTAAPTCVAFYQRISHDLEPNMDTPVYPDPLPPSYEDDIATNVAVPTIPQWGSNRATSDSLGTNLLGPIDAPSQETEFMLGRLSLGRSQTRISETSSSDSDQ